MTVVSTGRLVEQARLEHRAVLACNVITLEHAEAIATAVERTGVPAILQLSQNAVRHHGALASVAAAVAAVARAAVVPMALHLDHVEDVDLLHRAAEAGFSSVMVDAGALPYADNVVATRAAADWAHERGLWVEAELGHVGGKPGAARSAHDAGVRTDPDEAAGFVAATGVDALAVAVGSSHAMTDRSAQLDLALVARLREAVPVPLVLHGSSGVPVADLRAAVTAGITKINVGTALNVAFTGALRAALAEHPGVDPRPALAAARAATTDTVADLLAAVTPTPDGRGRHAR